MTSARRIDQELPATYTDAAGTEATWIHNDGQRLRMTLRGVPFRGRSFDDFEPSGEADPADLASFTLNQGELCSCAIECELLLTVVVDGAPEQATLHVRLELGDPAASGGIDAEELALRLDWSGGSVRSGGGSGWFEDELAVLRDALPEGTYMQACVSCAWSDYSPYGHGLFGDLACFRDCKQAYRAASSKQDLLELWDRRAGYVQETFVCPEFERRGAGAGYRG